jgi:hypothetical protein
MKVLRATLIGATLGLAALSVYLATAVVAEHARVRDVAEQRHALERRVAQLARKQHSASAVPAKVAAPALNPASSTQPAPSQQADDEEGDFGFSYTLTAQERLRTLTDPRKRGLRRIQQREDQRQVHPGLVSELGLSTEDADALFTILAEQDLRHEERAYRNEIAGRRELIDGAVLDSETQERDGIPERRRIDLLQDRLVADEVFSSAEANQLTQAMRLERAAFETEMKKLGDSIRYQAGYPEDARLHGAERPARLQFAEAHLARVEVFYERIRNRASAFLSPSQMYRLQQMQEERMADTRSRIAWSRHVAPAEEAMDEADAERRK